MERRNATTETDPEKIRRNVSRSLAKERQRRQSAAIAADFLKDPAKKTAGLLRATVEKLIDMLAGWRALDRLLVFDEMPVVIPPQLKADSDGGLAPGTWDQVTKRILLQPDVADQETADYPALAKGENLEQWVSSYPDTPLRTITARLLAVLVVLVFLTLMLIVGIAISV
jgi:hypothetical protein